MSSFAENLSAMVKRPRSTRKVARLARVGEKTIRNWLNRGDPSGNIKARQFLEAVDLPWPDALGDYELTPEWWTGFCAKFERAPAQQAAIKSVVVAFEAPETPPKQTASSTNIKVKRAS